MHRDMKECPHCGHDTYYITSTVSSRSQFHARYDGEDTENGEMYEGLIHENHKWAKWAKCSECGKRLFRVEV
ncbi:MAG: hypothetical protein RR554_11175 [Vagococcus sp.]|uniref:hypothetical protein n=1 Tax=Vagococcus sp. TaxID=1933889 RepID=UPI002FC8E5BC